MPVPDSEAVRVLRDFRVRMDAEDTRLMMDLGNRWLGVERSLSSEIGALAEEMSRRTAAGEQITTQMVYKAERYQVIQRQLETEVKKYNKDYAVNRIVDAQETAAALGVDAAQASIFASYPSPLSANFNRVNVAAVESLAGFAGDGTPLKKLLDAAVGDASDGIVSAMLAGLGSGQGAVAIARAMADGLGLGLDRSILIARTETQRAYRSGTVQQYRESGVVSGFMRLVKKDGACLGCLALDGELFELADELDDHPNGRCTAVPIVRGMEPPTWEKGEDWLANQDEAKQREILGPARFEMYQNGTPLSTFATKTHNDVWGSAPQVVSLKDLTEGGAVVERGGGLPPVISPSGALEPGGVPVSDALDISGIKNKEIRRESELALQSIDKIHGDGQLPNIPISQSGAGRNYGAFYSNSGTPIKISIAPKGDHKAFTALHEIGHFIDHSGLGSGLRWSSQVAGVENNVIVQTAKKSSWWKTFNGKALREGAGSELERTITLSPKYVRYVRGDKEIFARSYAQYIAEKTGDPALLSQLKKLQDGPFPTQWSTEDFKPISAEFDKLFRERGWIK